MHSLGIKINIKTDSINTEDDFVVCMSDHKKMLQILIIVLNKTIEYILCENKFIEVLLHDPCIVEIIDNMDIQVLSSEAGSISIQSIVNLFLKTRTSMTDVKDQVSFFLEKNGVSIL